MQVKNIPTAVTVAAGVAMVLSGIMLMYVGSIFIVGKGTMAVNPNGSSTAQWS